jgi:hypothetical protein
MTQSVPEPAPIIQKPLTPKGEGGEVVIVDPPTAALTLTPDAAEISGLRLIAEADRARRVIL